MRTKKDALRAHLPEWLSCRGDRKKRGALTLLLATTLKLHTKSISRSMKRLQMTPAHREDHRGRPRIYGTDIAAALAQLWEAMEYPCGENMTSSCIDTYIAFFLQENKWTYSHAVTTALLSLSESTKKRMIAQFRKRRGLGKGRSATIASPLKGMIPIRKSHTWHTLPPGYLQTDTVVHCGDYLSGDVVYSLGAVDFSTYWSEYTAQWNKGEVATQESLACIRERFPFVWKEIHPDSGSEFINAHVVRWSVREGIEMTRSEPYKKNDNMCIEERNNSIARKHLGYTRLSSATLVSLAASILHHSCLLSNHFKPVRRMINKVRIGSQWVRTFEKKALSPYERVLRSTEVSETSKQLLKKQHDALNPLHLKQELDILKMKLATELKLLK